MDDLTMMSDLHVFDPISGAPSRHVRPNTLIVLFVIRNRVKLLCNCEMIRDKPKELSKVTISNGKN